MCYIEFEYFIRHGGCYKEFTVVYRVGMLYEIRRFIEWVYKESAMVIKSGKIL